MTRSELEDSDDTNTAEIMVEDECVKQKVTNAHVYYKECKTFFERSIAMQKI